ncbi:MAG: lipoate--protein ligase [Treponema sp.]|jgi:lipoate-protein ligase A|nr:lipoate--protein ligase [Treponema sp.]
MISRIHSIETAETNPYRNIALEALLLRRLNAGSCILYLWQNRHTVVIGRNQNAWKECRVEALEASGGFLARRLSGGGAVYHDSGNLNFTFIMGKEDYDPEKQNEVILRALQAAGIEAHSSGRNDMEIEGRKFSGHAYYLAEKNVYHHGTLLVNAGLEAAAQYLSVSADKIRAKGVESVRKRIINLCELKSGLTIGELKVLLKKAFEEVYGLKSQALSPEAFEGEELDALEKQFSGPEWKYGKNPPFSFESSGRFPWGGVEVRLDVRENRVCEAAVYSDAMDEEFILKIQVLFRTLSFDRSSFRTALEEAFSESPERISCSGDILNLIFGV